MIAAEAEMLTPDAAGAELGFTHKHRGKTVLRLQKKGLVVTDLGHRTKRISKLDLQKFKNDQRALENARRK